MKHSTPRSRRHRNPTQGEKQEQPFFSNAHEKSKTDAPAPFFQAKLKIGQPGDTYEQEADQVADAVTGKSGAPPQVQAQGISRVQRYMTNAQEDELGTNTQRMEKDKAIQEKPELQCAEEEEPGLQKMDEPEEQLQQAPADEMGTEEKPEAQLQEEEEAQMQEEEPLQEQAEEEEQAQPKEEEEETAGMAQTKSTSPAPRRTGGLHRQLKQANGGGKPLPNAVRAQMESAMGADFSDVRIHTDRQARQMNRQLQAQAFTYGKDIFFNNGKFRPETGSGRHLLAHELTHVVQQGKAGAKSAASTAPQVQRQDGPANDAANGSLSPSLGQLDHGTTIYGGYSPFFDFSLRPEGPLPKIGELKIMHNVYYEPNDKLEKEDREKFATSFKSAVENSWSDKYMFHLQEAGFAEYKLRVKVEINEVDQADQAHTRINIHKRADTDDRLRSSVTDAEPGGNTKHTAELDYRDPSVETENSLDYAEKIWQVGPFDHDDSSLNPEVISDIREVESTLKPLQKGSDANLLLDERWYVDYIGRTTAIGNKGYNEKLGHSRAKAVEKQILDDLGRPQAAGRTSSQGEKNASNGEQFRRVDVKLWDVDRIFDPTKDKTKHNVAAHEAGHMFGLGDEYVDEKPPENVREKFAGDQPSHYDLVKDLMGQEAADELLIQNTGSLMSVGNEIKRGHYVFFLQALNKATGKNWKIIPNQTP